jgi:hypothetical protein
MLGIVTVLLLLAAPTNAATLEGGYAFLPGRFQGTSAQGFMPVAAISTPLGKEVDGALSAGYIRYGTDGRTSFVPISVGLRAAFKMAEPGPAAIYLEAGPSLVFARWRPSGVGGSGKRMLIGAICRGGVLIPVHGPLSLDLGLGYIVTEDDREDLVPDGLALPLEGIASALIQARLVLKR